MMLAIFAHVLALHESHIGAKGKSLRETRSRASPTDLGVADESIKVGDLRWIVNLAERRSIARQWKMVDLNAQRHRAAGNGFRFCRRLTLHEFGRPQPRSQSQTGGACCMLKETASSDSFNPVELTKMPANPFFDQPLPGPNLSVHRHLPFAEMARSINAGGRIRLPLPSRGINSVGLGLYHRFWEKTRG